MSFSQLWSQFRDRVRFAASIMLAVLALGLILRIVLYTAFHDGRFRPGHLALAAGSGLLFDVLTAMAALLPVWLLLVWLQLRPLGHRWVRFAVLALFFAGFCFLMAAEFFFFEEFNARFNHIALDYVLYPHEVVGNIHESYNVPLFALAAVVIGVVIAWPAQRLARGASFGPLTFAGKWRATLLTLTAAGMTFGLLCTIPASVSSNRITSEVAQNGMNQLVRAFMTAHLDYELYYLTLPEGEAQARAARFLGLDAPHDHQPATEASGLPLQRSLTPAASTNARRWDVVVIIEESLGSEFVGVLGHPELKTSREFDRWSREGLLLTNLVANGNRTVRGLEGILCSFVPLPGDSIVKRNRSENVASLARIFRDAGHRTSFFYGGLGIFDNMKPFMLANGYEEFVEQPSFPPGAFRTIWGVADEYVFDALIARQKESGRKGERLFATVMTVSNHKPYAVPHRIADRPDGERTRNGAVAYADWAIGHYLDSAKAAGLLDHTLVLIVGDHGARVYGSQDIPAASYRIPALFISPDPSWRGKRIERLCSQIDLGPTLLSLAGIECVAPFLGQDLTPLPAEGGRAFLQHNRDIGMLTEEVMVVLGLQKAVTFYQRPGRDSDTLKLVPPAQVTPAMLELQKDAAAVFQTAYEEYLGRRYRLPEPAVLLSGSHER